MFAVIMAGGQGTRLWPVSRKKRPKQLHSLISDNSIIRDTFLRLLPKFKPEEIFISTVPEFVTDIKKQLPEIPKANYIVEPFLMGNAAACGLVTKVLNLREKKSSVIFLPADAYIKDNKRFIEILNYANKTIKKYPDHILTLGITPTRPDTGLGYINIDKKLESSNSLSLNDNLTLFKVKKFVEKPDKETAEKYIKTKKFFWNAGIFVWQTEEMLKLFEKNLSTTYKVLNKIGATLNTKNANKVLNEEYAKVEKTSIDYGIMEKTNKIILIPSDFGWSDVGTWETLYGVLSSLKKSQNIVSSHHLGIDNDNSLVMSDTKKLIATIGLKDIVVVDTPDATLICKKSLSHKVKDLLKEIEEKYR